MGTIVKQLKIFVETLQKSIRQIEIEIGVSNGTLSKPFKAGKGITTDTLEKFFSRYEELNPIWVIKEKGSMILSVEEQEIIMSGLKEENTSGGFNLSQKKYLKDIIDDSLRDYKDELKETQKLLEMEKEIQFLRQQLNEKTKPASN
ncbi:hypothetical protein [Aquimarina algiphila]|uniref:Uncharacterized protein n=1 Tax=Aquimarina algiphila TaxID=2047982 RepID=A0A554VNQ0_9FLAO|nr:hypothetical protein [Aquimarina algiphila]TSE09994.1 hypothetical protein FOF46_06750 [Aquimarina algiphila]